MEMCKRPKRRALVAGNPDTEILDAGILGIVNEAACSERRCARSARLTTVRLATVRLAMRLALRLWGKPQLKAQQDTPEARAQHPSTERLTKRVASSSLPTQSRRTARNHLAARATAAVAIALSLQPQVTAWQRADQRPPGTASTNDAGRSPLLGRANRSQNPASTTPALSTQASTADQAATTQPSATQPSSTQAAPSGSRILSHFTAADSHSSHDSRSSGAPGDSKTRETEDTNNERLEESGAAASGVATSAAPRRAASGRSIGLREILPLIGIVGAALAIVGWQLAGRFRPRRPVDFPFSYINEDDSSHRRHRRHRNHRPPRKPRGAGGSVDFPYMNAERIEQRAAAQQRKSSES